MTIEFINAIITWLSDFPSSPLKNTDDYSVLCERNTIYSLFSALTGKDLAGNLDFKYETIAELIVDNNDDSFELVNKLLKIIDFNLIFEDKHIPAITLFCKFMYYFGTRCSKFSSFGIISLSYLAETDKKAIDDYFANTRNSILLNISEKIHLLQKMIVENKERLLVNEIQLEIEELTSSCAFSHPRLLSPPSSKPVSTTSSKSYVDENYLQALIWEISTLERVLYFLVLNRAE